MKKSLLKIKSIEIITTFSPEEKSDFKKFLSSPYFNSNSKLIKLYNVILESENEIVNNSISEKDIYLKLFQKDKFSYSSMRNLMSGLFRMCEEFLVVNAIKRSEECYFDNKLKLLKEYSNRFLDNNYHIVYKKADKELNYKFLGYKYFEFKSKLNYSLANFEWMRNNSDKRRVAVYEECLNNICTVVSTLSENISAHNYSKLAYNYTPEVKPAESLIKNLDIKKFLKDLESLDDLRYYHISTEVKFIKLILEPDNFENYYQLHKDITNNISKYSNTEKSYHCSRLFSFLINHLQKGNNKLIREVSNFRKFQMENIKYGSDGMDKLSIRIFLDMIDTFLITESDVFVENFIKKNLDKVETINRENAFHYASSRLELKKKNFEKTIEHISKMKLTEHFMKFQSKMILLQAFYEMENFESGLYALDSLKHFMKSSKSINSSLKLKLNQLIGIFDKIYKISIKPESYTMFDLDKLISEVKKINSANTTWYELKIEELRKHYTSKRKLQRSA